MNFIGVNDPAEMVSLLSMTPLKLLEFFLRNYEIVKKFKNFMRNFSGVIDLAETLSAGSLTTLK
jgi:hypothetical protein